MAVHMRASHMGTVHRDDRAAIVAITIAAASPVALCVGFASGSWLGIHLTGVLTVAVALTALLTAHALTVMALLREYRKRIGGGGRHE